MRQLPKTSQKPELLVSNDTADDAGVYQLTEEIALVQSTDFFTPIVDDAYMFGQIAAANALSDIYAMGGDPITALNIVGYPIKKLGPQILAEIMRGAAAKVDEADAVTIGGHSIDDNEPKFGLSVTGTVHPKKIWKNVGAISGDSLVLTKPIGVGIITTGIKRSLVSKEQAKAVTTVMATLNKQAAELLKSYHVHAVTDITGFGLLGHASEMAKGSGVSFAINYQQVPILDGALQLAEKGAIPGGSKANHKWLKEDVHYDPSLSLSKQLVLCDAITSGGLLIAMPQTEAESYVKEMHRAGALDTAIIGKVIEQDSRTCIYVKN